VSYDSFHFRLTYLLLGGEVYLKNLDKNRGSRISPAKSSLDRGLCINLH